MAEETKRAQTPAHRLGRTGLNVWRNVKFVYILKISACGVSVLLEFPYSKISACGTACHAEEPGSPRLVVRLLLGVGEARG